MKMKKHKEKITWQAGETILQFIKRLKEYYGVQTKNKKKENTQ